MTGSYVLDFKHEDVNEPRPWPVGIKDGIVTSGLGDDDGAALIGFAIQGEQRAVFLADQIEAIDWDQDELVPVFSNAGGFFNWDIPIRGIRKIEVAEVITDKHFKLDIQMSNEAMLTGDAIADALRTIAHNHVFDHVQSRAIYDTNGAVVGKWEFVEVAR